MELINFLSYGFIQRALIAGSCIGLLCSLLGVFLVLRRLSLIGDGLAHVTFGSIALGLLLSFSPLYISLPVVMACSVGILKLMERGRLYGDAAIGIVSSVGIAGGTLMASLAGGFNVDLFSYLFGNILAISTTEVLISMTLSAAVIITIAVFYNELFSLTFDEEFARTTGIKTGKINTVFILATALTVVLATRVVGILLVSSLLILPAVTSLQLARGFKLAIGISCIIGVVSVMAGIVISFLLNLPAGATIVMLNLLFFLAALIYRSAGRA
jgi:zinc transport system permease protein